MPKKILVVDDDLHYLQAMKIRLTENGYAVVTAKDGLEGLELTGREKPDLIITDVIMPGKDGPEFIFDLQEKYPGIKMIAVSAGGQDYLDSIKKDSTVKRVVGKPFDMVEMLKVIKEVLG